MSNPPLIPSHLLSSIPTSAIPIPPPDLSSTGSSSTSKATLKSPTTTTSIPSFPPTSNTSTSSNAPKKSNPISMSLSTNVSDLLLSSLLPPNLPKLPSSSINSSTGGGTSRLNGVGAPRELSTQRDGLSLPLMSNNFRRFVTRVGPVFWIQDRVEEILFWRKPIWTWAWMMIWTFICFQPRVLLLLPSLILILILLHTHERLLPLPSLIGISSSSPATITDRKFIPPSPDLSKNSTSSSSSNAVATGTAAGGGGYSTSTTKDAEGETVEKVVVNPKESESGVDVYMNLQGIQNLMGLVSDGYDFIAPRLSILQTPNTPNSSPNLPINFTHLVLIALPPTLVLPLTPSFLIPYILLPMGIIPPLIFHPNLTPWLFTLPSNRFIKKIRSVVETLLLDDRLSDNIGSKKIEKVEVWENERLDPKLSIKTNDSSSTSASSGSANNTSSSGPVIPVGSWSSKNLRASDKSPWVKVSSDTTKWKTVEDIPLPSSASTADKDKGEDKQASDKMILALKSGWDWIPGEDWRIDISGLWSDKGVDEEGWLYTDDSWQNPAPTPYTEADSPSTDKYTTNVPGTMPGLALRRTTRRRRWWRRVYEVSGEV